jgi:hypothetical protein
MQPLWEQSISFKQALAIAAVQKRRVDAVLQQQEQRTAELEQQIEHLKSELAKYQADTSSELLLNACFNSSSPSSLASEEEQSSSDYFSHQLETLAISATLWNRASENLPPSAHGFLCRVLEFSSRRRRTGVENTTTLSISSCISPLEAVGTPTPTQALIQLTQDIVTAPCMSSKTTEILVNAASYLGELCKHPHECLTAQDFSLLQEFISTLITTSCCRTLLPANINAEEEENTTTTKLKNGLAPSSTGSVKSTLLEAFQSSCGTGYLVLGCAAHTLHRFIQRLRALVTGDLIMEPPPPPPPPQQQQQQSLPPPPENLIETRIEADFSTEESLVTACGSIACIVQACLRELPSWSVELPFQDEFLREIATAVWDVSVASKVIAPVHGEIAKQGQRCAALLVSALQKMSLANSREDYGTATMNTFD